MTDWPTWLTTAAGSGVGGLAIWGLIEIIKTVANSKVRDTTAAAELSDSALALVQQAEKNAKEARDEAREARREAAEARREATEARREAMQAVANMRRITTAILSPYATLEGLRAMVDPPSSNGNGTALVNR